MVTEIATVNFTVQQNDRSKLTKQTENGKH